MNLHSRCFLLSFLICLSFSLFGQSERKFYSGVNVSTFPGDFELISLQEASGYTLVKQGKKSRYYIQKTKSSKDDLVAALHYLTGLKVTTKPKQLKKLDEYGKTKMSNAIAQKPAIAESYLKGKFIGDKTLVNLHYAAKIYNDLNSLDRLNQELCSKSPGINTTNYQKEFDQSQEMKVECKDLLSKIHLNEAMRMAGKATMRYQFLDAQRRAVHSTAFRTSVAATEFMENNKKPATTVFYLAPIQVSGANIISPLGEQQRILNGLSLSGYPMFELGTERTANVEMLVKAYDFTYDYPKNEPTSKTVSKEIDGKVYTAVLTTHNVESTGTIKCTAIITDLQTGKIISSEDYEPYITDNKSYSTYTGDSRALSKRQKKRVAETKPQRLTAKEIGESVRSEMAERTRRVILSFADKVGK